jgi:hypothetical protein
MRVIWFSPPCQQYSNATKISNPSPKYPEIGDFNLRQLGVAYGDEYVIENVETCVDLYNETKLNGYGFKMPINMTRHFETSFNCPDKYSGSKTKDYVLENGIHRRQAHDLLNCRKKDLIFIKDAPENCTVKELRPYIPPFYVWHILKHIEKDNNIAQFVDCFCGVGGVSRAVHKYDPDIDIVGIDHLDKKSRGKYPFEFIHGKVTSFNISKAIDRIC